MSWKFLAAVLHTLRRFDLDSYLWSRGECYGTETVTTITDLIFDQGKQQHTLLELLRKTRSYQSSLPSDKIYGLLNLVSDPDQVQVDYTKEGSAVYSDLTMDHIVRSKDLDILYDCYGVHLSSNLTLPSWVPDWTKPKWHNAVMSWNLPFAAAGTSQVKFHLDKDHGILEVEGRVLDTVSQVEMIRKIPRKTDPGDRLSASDEPLWRKRPGLKPWHFRETDGKPFWQSSHEGYLEESRLNRRAWINNVMSLAFPNKSVTAEQFETLWRMFVWDVTPAGLQAPPEYGEYFSGWLISITGTPEEIDAHLASEKASRISLDLRDDMTRINPDVLEKAMVFGKANARCYNRRFYCSTGGRFGWGVDGMEVGDQICILHGLSAPLILRQVENGGHKVIGDTYIHGLMYGEGIEATLPECNFRLV
jgi:hypothetical protein